MYTAVKLMLVNSVYLQVIALCFKSYTASKLFWELGF